MIPTGSRLLIGATLLSIVAAIIYGTTVSGSLGTTGLISLSVAFGLITAINLFTRDADVSVNDPTAATESAAAHHAPRPSIWPIVAGGGGVLLVLGLITYPATAGDADKVFEAALEAGAEDVTSSEDGHEIWTAQGDLHEVAKALEPVLGEAEGAKLAWKPQTTVEVDEANAATLLKLVDTLDDDDDVQTVWGNYAVPDDVMEKLG